MSFNFFRNFIYYNFYNKTKKKYQNSNFILVDCLILLMGIIFYILLSLYTNIKDIKLYHLFSIIFIQCFFVYPGIFILKKISLKIFKKKVN